MSTKVLFVDDEQSVLNGIERRLGLEFDLTTASSGSDALVEIEKNGPFGVVITDMQMPRMNGVQFIQNARKLAPDTVYMMLTGNQDQATASQAVNEGKVFRFLNKPCEMEEIRRAVEVGLRQYKLVTGEKELLQKTFVGAVGLLTEVLEISQPEIFSEVPNIERIFENLRLAAEVEEHWEFKLAVRLGLLGIALLPDSERHRFQSTSPTDQLANEMLNQASLVAGRLIDKIPRLHTVAEIIQHQADVDGNIFDLSGKQRLVQLGATFLRVAIKWNLFSKIGLNGQVALAELHKELPKLSSQLGKALLEMESQQETEPAVEVAVCDLREGMVLADDIVTDDGAILLRKGRLLSWTIVEKLHIRKLDNKEIRPIQIIESTCREADNVLCS